MNLAHIRPPRTFRARIILNSALVLGIIAPATLYTGLATSELARSVGVLFRDNLVLEHISDALNRTETGLAGYLGTKSSDFLKDYIRYSTQLGEESRKLNRDIRRNQPLLLQRELAGLIDRYLEDAEASVTAKRGRDVTTYTERFEYSERTAALARLLISRIEGLSLSDSIVAFSDFNSRISAVITTNSILVIAATLLSLTLLVRFSYRITDPLSKLAAAAHAVGRGEYDHELPLSDSSDEVGATAAAFMSMQRSIRAAFDELKSKAEVEKRLMEERVIVLDMRHRLKDAELLALQSQINPHFLFNTLSAGLQLARLEEARRTGDFLENLGGFIRYALKPATRSVLLRDEIECVQRYIWLLRLRFGERYSFDVDASDDVLGVETPALLLQPLVENAVAHGLRNREEGGHVWVTARLDGASAVLEVGDDGEGMAQDDIERIIGEALRMRDAGNEADPGEARPADGSSAEEGGIGLINVIRRVDLATEGRGRVEMHNVAGSGMRVRVVIPAGGPA